MDTRVEDIKRFLDAMRIDRVTLIGHSMAGDEMTKFAALYPHRVSKLVYLDAALDWDRAKKFWRWLAKFEPFCLRRDELIEGDAVMRVKPEGCRTWVATLRPC